MNGKKAILALVAGFVLSNVLTTIYYIITDEPNFVPIRREETVFIGLFLTHLIFVGIMVIMFPRWARPDGSLIRQGGIFGVLMSAMMFVPQAILVRSIWTVDFNLIFVVNSIAHLVIGAIVGAVIAWVYGRPTGELAL